MPHRLKVVLIEDEKIDVMGVGKVLKEFHPHVLLEVVGTGEQALEWIHRFRQDGERVALILMDMTLPRMHGLDLLSPIKKNPDLTATPVVVLSGNDSSEAIRLAYQSGACAYVVKKSEFAEMKNVLRRVFDFWLRANTLIPTPESG